MKRLWLSAFLIGLLCMNAVAHVSLLEKRRTANQDVTIKTEKVGGNVYVLFGQGGNIGVSVGSDGILMIDDQFERLADKIKAALKELGSEKPRFVFNTHWHGDHTGGNPVFGKDSTIIAHFNVRKRMAETTMFRGQKREPSPAVALPSITYDDGLTVHFNGEEVRAVHYPNGHTDGDTVLFFTKSNVVHLGDDFFAGRFPFVDRESGGSVEGLTRNIGELLKTIPKDAKLIPGHGPVSTHDDLKTYHQMLIETVGTVRDAMKRKKSLDEIKKAGFPEKYKDWSWSFISADMWIETIYNEYSPNMKKKS